jgi:putative membrane protein
MAGDNRAGPDDPRVFLAVQRTFLAWTRTALALMGFGFVIARVGLLPSDFAGGAGATPLAESAPLASLWLGVILVVMGVGVQAMALAEYLQFERGYVAGAATPPARSYHAPLLGLALVVIGAGIAVYLILFL